MMRINNQNAKLLDVTLSNREAILDYIKENYPSGPLGELLFKADASQNKLNNVLELLENSEPHITKYKIVIIGDAKAKYNKFGLVSLTGVPFYCGHFLEPRIGDSCSEQNTCETRALVYAIRLCRDFCYYKNISLKDLTLHYLTDSQAVIHSFKNPTMTNDMHALRDIQREIPLNIEIDWIRGIDNLADKFTLTGACIVHPCYENMNDFLEKQNVTKK